MTENSENIFYQTYFKYIGETEAPLVFHRWAITSAVAAMLGRQVSFPFGHLTLYPNMYNVIVGSAGTRKSTAISIASKLISKAGYVDFAPDKCSKEQFLQSLGKMADPVDEFGNPIDLEDLLDMTLETKSELFIDADEFSDFIEHGDTGFITMLTKLWDCKDKYLHPKLNSDDVEVKNPCVNILAGTTTEGFAMAFPPEVIGLGFTSRLMFIQAEASNVRIPWPKPPSEELQGELIDWLRAMQNNIKGEFTVSPEAKLILEECYTKWPPLDDMRFAHYSTRRFTLLLKLCMTLAAMDMSMVVLPKHALQANTMMHYAECRMPKALAEYGKSKNSEQQAAILKTLEGETRPVPIAFLWKRLNTEITRQSELIDILKNLVLADKVRAVQTDTGGAFMRVEKAREVWSEELILTDFLELEEMA